MQAYTTDAKRLQRPQQSLLDLYAFARRMSVLFAAVICLLVTAPLVLGGRITDTLAQYLAFKQDLPLLPLFLLALLCRPRHASSRPTVTGLDDNRLVLSVSVLVILTVGWLGSQLVFQGYALSRDEQMAVFDQEIFARGALMWPIPMEWRPMADALGRRFMMPIGANEYWVSAYLPIHAAFRALVKLVADPALSSPILTVLAAVCTWAVSRRLWPDSNRTAVLGLLLLGTSSQVLITSMTTFSMSMHLALNMLWLVFFLSGRWRTHIAAAIVGFFATGIHQPLFHPLFVLPFFILLATQRRWRVFVFYVASYALIAAFWLWWPHWISSHGSSPSLAIDCANTNCSSGVGFVDRLLFTMANINFASSLWLTAANLLRFLAWQHPLLLPLALFGAISCWRTEPLVRVLAAGFVLPVVVLAVLLPWQGHGWGYRYVHPVLGNAVLLACYGFHRLESGGLSLRRPILVTTAAAMAILPVHAWMAWRMVKPMAQIRAELEATPADVVIVDTEGVPFGQDIVLNRFDLSNRPKLLIAKLLKPENMPSLCRESTIAFYDARRMAGLSELYSVRVIQERSREASILHEVAAALHCRMPFEPREAGLKSRPMRPI